MTNARVSSDYATRTSARATSTTLPSGIDTQSRPELCDESHDTRWAPGCEHHRRRGRHRLVEPGFEGVRSAFARNPAAGHEVGAALCVHVGGRKVVDVCGGSFDADGARPYGPDALQLVFSSTKGATATCANLLAQRGLLDLDAPVAHYWPEFAQAGKETLPVRLLLSHQAGLPAIDRALTPEEVQAWDPVIEALAAQAPLWEPGTAHGYHTLTYGYLVGEVVRRISGRSLGTFFAEEVAGPLGLVVHRAAPGARAAGLPRGGGADRWRRHGRKGLGATLLARALTWRRGSGTGSG